MYTLTAVQKSAESTSAIGEQNSQALAIYDGHA